MSTRAFKIGGLAFLMAGAAEIGAGLLGRRMIFILLGCSFLAIGGAWLGLSAKQPRA